MQEARWKALHRNLILVNARSPEEASAKAVSDGEDGEKDCQEP